MSENDKGYRQTIPSAVTPEAALSAFPEDLRPDLRKAAIDYVISSGLPPDLHGPKQTEFIVMWGPVFVPPELLPGVESKLSDLVEPKDNRSAHPFQTYDAEVVLFKLDKD